MIGGARVETALDPATGRTRLIDLQASAPLAIKHAAGTVYLIGAAAAPLDGDLVTIELVVAAGTQLTVRTVAATMAWPSRERRDASRLELRASVGEGASLRWLPEPLVPVRGSHHVMLTSISLAPTARLVWREEIILGRAGEPPGTLTTRTRVERAGSPLLHQELAVDGSPAATHRSPALLGDAGATGSVLVAGPGTADHAATIHDAALRGAVLELEHGGRLATATATGAARLQRWLDERQAGLEPASMLRRPPTRASTPTTEVTLP